MRCQKCLGKGFIEYEAGLIQVKCGECNGAGDIGITQDVELGGILADGDGVSSGIEQVDKPTGSADTGQSKRTRKPKAKKKATERTS